MKSGVHTIRGLYRCTAVRKRVLILRHTEVAAGIGGDVAEPVVLLEVCSIAPTCEHYCDCPLRPPTGAD